MLKLMWEFFSFTAAGIHLRCSPVTHKGQFAEHCAAVDQCPVWLLLHLRKYNMFWSHSHRLKLGHAGAWWLALWPYSKKVTGLSQSPKPWRLWIKVNRTHFSIDCRCEWLWNGELSSICPALNLRLWGIPGDRSVSRQVVDLTNMFTRVN